MTRAEIINQLAAIERVLATRVPIVRVILAPDGTVVGHITRGSFRAPPGWQPPDLNDLITTTKSGRTND